MVEIEITRERVKETYPSLGKKRRKYGSGSHNIFVTKPNGKKYTRNHRWIWVTVSAFSERERQKNGNQDKKKASDEEVNEIPRQRRFFSEEGAITLNSVKEKQLTTLEPVKLRCGLNRQE